MDNSGYYSDLKIVDIENFCLDLFEIGAVKFGLFKLKSGIEDNIYIDLRTIISYPDLMKTVCNMIIRKINSAKIKLDNICGVPYAALPVASIVADRLDKPIILRRKEVKEHGTKKLIEGYFEKGDVCIIIEDVISTGSSILETIRDVEKEGLVVKDVIVLLNREEKGGEKVITDAGYKLHYLCTLKKLIEVLERDRKITAYDEDLYRSISECDISGRTLTSRCHSYRRLKMSYKERMGHSKSNISSKIFEIIDEKKSNLCVAVDVPDVKSIIEISDKIGPHICILKLHMDIVKYDQDDISKLKTLSLKHNFLIMEDRKLADIGNTVSLQVSRFFEYSTLITAHGISGEGLVKGIRNCKDFNENRAIFLIAEMSSKGNLFSLDYSRKVVQIGLNNPDVVCGFVCQCGSLLADPGFIQMTPGVMISSTQDNIDQQYNSPEQVMINGADIAVVGRGIIAAKNPELSVLEYKQRLWNAYLRRLSG